MGLFNSGSTVIAGVLHRLGVNIGAPFWGSFYEPLDLRNELIQWWNEPQIREVVKQENRVRLLKAWLQLHSNGGDAPIGAKHPLLCLCGNDLIKAWGKDIHFIWAYRPLDESIERLKIRRWYSNHDAEAMQSILWHASNSFINEVEHLKVEYSEMCGHKHREINRIVEYLGLEPSHAQLEEAVEFIKMPRRK